jgi:single-stranded-DNA-specific exonuclease
MITTPRKRWNIPSQIPVEVRQQLQKYSPVMQQILYNRGITTAIAAQEYLEAASPPGCEPNNMLGIPQAVERIDYAIKSSQAIAIYGDYDVDGVTATALLTTLLRSIGANVIGYIPNRFDEGYGLNIEALRALHEQGVKLVISVDCGIRSPLEADFAKQIGLDLIITDHHHPSDVLPDAYTIINPKQLGDDYPDKNLAGVGIAYKLAEALLEKTSGSRATQTDPQDYLDLVALGTVADIAPLIGENRSMVRAGLQRINRQQRQGLRSLLGVAGYQNKFITAEDIGFVIGPRLNAAGRLDTAQAALELLVSQDVQKTGYLAQLLDQQNQERQRITREIQIHAETYALAQEEAPYILFAVDENYNPGVVGLAASKLQEKFYRPAVVAHQGENFTRASCRSIPEFHITDALDQCAELMEHHGGHAAAAGFTIRNDRLDELIQRLRAIAEKELHDKDLRPVLKADIDIPLSELKPEILKELDKLQPTGQKNPSALFASRNLKVIKKRALGKENAHLKMVVSDGSIYYDAIAFRFGHWVDKLPAEIDMIYAYEVNEYNGRTSIQLNVRDLRPSGMPD